MFLSELREPQLLVILPGRFQPWHKGHHAVYNWLTGKFGRNNVYIATSNKTDNLKSPFSFAEKAYFMQLTGVPADRIIQATSPYQIDSVLAGGQVTVQNPDNTVVIFAVSEKDMAEDPRFSFAPKKDGSDSFFQPLKNIKDTKSMKQHGYIMTVPTFDFAVLGKPATSASEIRAQYKDADEKTRQAIVKDLFGRYTAEAEQIMNSKLAPAPAPTGTQPVAEDAAGVGVVKGGRDPRYVMATTGDQNDVTAATPKKNLKAFSLAEEDIDETIRKLGSQYRLYSGKGKNLGTFPTRAGAEKHEREVQYFKHANEGVAENWGEPLTGWHIVYARTGNKVSGTPDFDSRDSAQKYLMTKMSANHHNYRVAHADNLGTSAPTPMGGYLEETDDDDHGYLPTNLKLGAYRDEWDPRDYSAYPDEFKSNEQLREIVYNLVEEGVEPTVEVVSPRALIATQDWLADDRYRDGDPVFEEYEDHPVVLKVKLGEFYILDGHHRCSRALAANRMVKVYMFVAPQGVAEETKQRLDPKCWKGYHKAGTKMKGDTRVNNCVKNEGAVDDLEARRIEDLNRLMDEILTRFRTEKLPAQYRDALKQRLEKLKAERNSYYHART